MSLAWEKESFSHEMNERSQVPVLSDSKLRELTAKPNRDGDSPATLPHETDVSIESTPVVRGLDRITVMPRPWRPRRLEQFKVLAQWEGYVTVVHDDRFEAHLVGEHEGSEDANAEFSFEEVDPEDLELIVDGAVFYWTIGYHDTQSGRRRSSELRFRRLPMWTQQDIDDAHRWSDSLDELFEGADEI